MFTPPVTSRERKLWGGRGGEGDGSGSGWGGGKGKGGSSSMQDQETGQKTDRGCKSGSGLEKKFGKLVVSTRKGGEAMSKENLEAREQALSEVS